MADKETKFITKDGQGYTLISQAAKASIKAQSIDVPTSGNAVKLPTTPLTSRKVLFIQNLETPTFWIGADVNVTSSNGFAIAKDNMIRLNVSDDVDVFAKADDANAEARILELS
jgi:hypothetical protein